jgi:hypothetical protein
VFAFSGPFLLVPAAIAAAALAGHRRTVKRMAGCERLPALST